MLPPPPVHYESVASAASGFDFDPPAGLTHGVRIALDAESFDGSCILFDETGENPIEGLDEAALSLSCPNAHSSGAVSLADEPQSDGSVKRVWTLHGHADAVSGGDADANIYVADTYTAALPPPASAPAATPAPTPTAAHLFLHVDLSGALALGASGFAEYESDARFWTVLPDGSFERLAPAGFPSEFDRFVHTAGNHHDVYDVDLPPVDFGTPVLMDSGFLFDLAIANGGSGFLSDATATVSLCSRDAQVAIASASGSTGDCPAMGNLQLVSIEPVQSVRDPSAPNAVAMIGGKDAVLRVVVKNTFPEPVPARITFDVDQAGAPTRELVEAVTVPACPDGKVFYFPDPDPASTDCASSAQTGTGLHERGGFEPLSLGLTYHVGGDIVPSDPGLNESRTDDNHVEATLPVEVTKLTLVYDKIECTSGACSYGGLRAGEYSTAIQYSDLHTLAMFPVAPANPLVESEGYRSSRCTNTDGTECVVPGRTGLCGDPTDFGTCGAILGDLQEAFEASYDANPDLSRVVSMVPGGYFQDHHYNQNPAGLFAPHRGVNGVVVVKAEAIAGTNPNANPGVHFPVAPHELIHSYNFLDHLSDRPTGYWVNCPSSACEISPSSSQNVMAVTSPGEPPTAWIDPRTYAEILLPKVRAKADPPVLLMVGSESSDGQVTLDVVREFSKGHLENSEPGDESVEMLDDSGAVLSTVSMESTFVVCADSTPAPSPTPGPLQPNPGLPEGCFPTSRILITLPLAYPLETATVRFLKSGKLQLEFDPVTRTLRDAIRAVPDRGYAKNASERRAALLYKVDAFEKTLARKDFQAALNQLDHDIRDKVEKWIVDYSGSPEELSKEKVLTQIDEIDERLHTRMASVPQR